MKDFDLLNIKCPHCGGQVEYKTYASINSKSDPELKEQLLSGQLFRYECPHCHEKGYLGFPFLYHDPVNHILIQYTSPEKRDETLKTFISNIAKAKEILGNEFDKYRYRLVDEFGLLCEKISCFDNGLDDRVLEITKILVGYILEQRNQINDDERLYLYDAGDHLRADIINQNVKTMKQIKINKEIYNVAKRDYSQYFDEEKTKFAIINEEWAATLLNKISKKN